MATKTSVGSGLWSEAGTWDTGVPVDTDAVVIALGHVVEFDADTSAFATGIAGLTCTGTFQCSTSPGTYHLKMAGNITGTGSFLAGTAETPLPTTVKFSIQMNGSYQFNGVVTLALYGTNPTNTYVKLTALEPIAETVMAVDTDVTSDIWAAGDLVRLCNINKAQETEQYTIAGGGIATGTITLTAGLSAAKSIGAYLVLCSRNVRIYGHTANTYCVNNCTNAVLQCEIYGGHTGQPSSTNAGRVATSSTGVVLSGSAHGSSRGLQSCAGATLSGAFAGLDSAAFSCYGSVFSGLFAGHQYCVYSCYGAIASGIFIGNSRAGYLSDGLVISGILSGNT